MSWSRSSKLGLAVLLVVGIAATVGVASAVSVTQADVPAEAEAGQEITVSAELGELYTDNQEWQLDGQTELENANWTIELSQGDTVVATETFRRDSPEPVTINQSAEEAPDSARVEVTGTVPQPDTFGYQDPPTFLGLEVAAVSAGGEDVSIIERWEIQQVASGDPGSQEARTALDSARDAIDTAQSEGRDVSDAQSDFDQAVQAFEAGNFQFAVDLAQSADDAASADTTDGSTDGSDSGGTTDGSDTGGTTDGSDSGDSTDGTTSDGASDGADSGAETDGSDGNSTGSEDGDGDDDGGIFPILLYVLLGIVILAAVGGGVYYYQQQQGPSRDPLG